MDNRSLAEIMGLSNLDVIYISCSIGLLVFIIMMVCGPPKGWDKDKKDDTK